MDRCSYCGQAQPTERPCAECPAIPEKTLESPNEAAARMVVLTTSDPPEILDNRYEVNGLKSDSLAPECFGKTMWSAHRMDHFREERCARCGQTRLEISEARSRIVNAGAARARFVFLKQCEIESVRVTHLMPTEDGCYTLAKMGLFELSKLGLESIYADLRQFAVDIVVEAKRRGVYPSVAFAALWLDVDFNHNNDRLVWKMCANINVAPALDPEALALARSGRKE